MLYQINFVQKDINFVQKDIKKDRVLFSLR